MSKRELDLLLDSAIRNGSRVKKGYCCYQEDGIKRKDMIFIANNGGSYGWNWTVYYCKSNDTFYVSGYRNY